MVKCQVFSSSSSFLKIACAVAGGRRKGIRRFLNGYVRRHVRQEENFWHEGTQMAREEPFLLEEAAGREAEKQDRATDIRGMNKGRSAWSAAFPSPLLSILEVPRHSSQSTCHERHAQAHMGSGRSHEGSSPREGHTE